VSAETARAQANRTLLAAIVATVAMLFTAFAAAYLERSSARGWTTVRLPGLLWLNTALLLASSVSVELARRHAGGGWLKATFGLGVLFLAGQVGAWLVLRSQGVFLPTNPYAAFFYVLSGLHALHVVGGLIALAVAGARPRLLPLCAGYWHFMGLVWIYILAVLWVL